MRRAVGLICFIAGEILVVSALLVLIYNVYEDRSAGETAAEALAAVRTEMEARSLRNDEKPAAAIQLSDGGSEPEKSSEQIESTVEYMGCLSIPVLGLELPVAAEWSYPALKAVPCRQCGTVGTRGLVIAGHNYTHHFGKLENLTPGDSVTFTDMDGGAFYYEVTDLSVVEPTDAAAVTKSGADLTLYTCTYGGRARVAVFCRASES